MDRSFDHSVFSKNRQRLLDADVAREFLLAIVDQARERHLLPEEHFSVAGTPGGMGVDKECPAQG